MMDVGAVLDVEDVAGGKVCALASRVEPRDYADTAAMLGRYSPAELIGFARRLDPGLGARDFADAGRQLDHIDDERLPDTVSPAVTSPCCGSGSLPGPGPPKQPRTKSWPSGRPWSARPLSPGLPRTAKNLAQPPDPSRRTADLTLTPALKNQSPGCETESSASAGSAIPARAEGRLPGCNGSRQGDPGSARALGRTRQCVVVGSVGDGFVAADGVPERFVLTVYAWVPILSADMAISHGLTCAGFALPGDRAIRRP